MIRLAQALSIKSGESRMASLMIGIMLFIIATGEVSVIASKDQKEVELARRKAGEFIGEMALLSKAPRNATVEALGDVRTLCINQKSFEALLRDRPAASLAVIQVLCKRLNEADQKLHR